MKLKFFLSLLFALLIAIHKFIYPLVIDTTTSILIVFVLSPWLPFLFRSIQLPGGWKIEFAEFKTSMEDTKGAAESAEKKAELAMSLLDVSMIKDTKKGTLKISNSINPMANEIQKIANNVNPDDISELLSSHDKEKQFKAIANLYIFPKVSLLSEVISILEKEESSADIYYWAIQVVINTLRINNKKLAQSDINRLVLIKNNIRRGTAEHYEFNKALKPLIINQQAKYNG